MQKKIRAVSMALGMAFSPLFTGCSDEADEAEARAQAEEMVRSGGIGLAESLFHALKDR